MIKKVFEIVDKKIMKVDILNGVGRIQNIYLDEGIECFTAYEDNALAGIVTKRELVGAHPNRIIEDVMSKKYKCVNHGMCVWEAADEFKRYKETDIILVECEGTIIGYINKMILDIELGKHIDILTGLYKSDYMFYNIYNHIKKKQNIVFLFIDLNNFGYIDKKYGHMNGDIILKTVADILKNNIDENCRLCRYGGDEFAVVAPYYIDEGMQLAEKILEAIGTYDFINNISVSAAIGLIEYRANNDEIENIYVLVNEIINAASLASTKAKKESDNYIYVESLNKDAIVYT